MALPVQVNANLTLNLPIKPQHRLKLLHQMEDGVSLLLLQYPLPPVRIMLEDGVSLPLLQYPPLPLRIMLEDGVNHPLSTLPKPTLLNRMRSIHT